MIISTFNPNLLDLGSAVGGLTWGDVPWMVVIGYWLLATGG
jgi:hypothetical protein